MDEDPAPESSVLFRAASRLTRLYPFLSGGGRIVNSGGFRRLMPLRKSSDWVDVVGGRILVSNDDYVGRAIFFTGDYDRKISWVIDHGILPGDTVLDIGANCGLTALRMAARAGPAGRVHAFEPNPSVLRVLRRTLDANPGRNISLHAVALGDRNAEQELFSPKHNDGAASLLVGDRAGFSGIGRVPVRRLTDYLDEIGIERVDFIKTDVEGYEARVFEGGLDLIRRAAPRLVVFEELGQSADGSAPASIRILQSAGYRIFALPKSLLSCRLVPLAQAFDRKAHDYVAISPSCERSVLQRLRLA